MHAANGKAQHTLMRGLFFFLFKVGWGGVGWGEVGGSFFFVFIPCSQCVPNMFSSCSQKVPKFSICSPTCTHELINMNHTMSSQLQLWVVNNFAMTSLLFTLTHGIYICYVRLLYHLGLLCYKILSVIHLFCLLLIHVNCFFNY